MANSGSEATLATPVLTPAEQRDAYLKQLLTTAAAAVPSDLALSDLRATATALVKEQTFPSTRQEDWRFTDLSGMLELPFQAATAMVLDGSTLADWRLPEATGACLVMVNGQFRADLSQTGALPDGVISGSLRQLWSNAELRPKLAARLAQSSGSHELFTALNTTGFQDAVVLWVPRGQVIETPVQILYVHQSGTNPTMVQPRCLVVAEANSTLTLVEDFRGSGDGDSFTNAVSELWLDANAQLTHVWVQREEQGTFHIGKTAVAQGQDSRYSATTITLGAKLCRHNFQVYQTGPQTETTLYGLEAVGHTQHTDTHSLVALSQPHGTVDQLHKGIVDDKGHSVFSGRIVVSQAAQFTHARQLNRNLLLSNQARVDTKPQLEIVADNVKCAHGATVSQLQADEIFYLQSRGIEQSQAQRLLIYAFGMEILDRLPVPSLKTTLTQSLAQWT